jgi:hypothetical protein
MRGSTLRRHDLSACIRKKAVVLICPICRGDCGMLMTIPSTLSILLYVATIWCFTFVIRTMLAETVSDKVSSPTAKDSRVEPVPMTVLFPCVWTTQMNVSIVVVGAEPVVDAFDGRAPRLGTSSVVVT